MNNNNKQNQDRRVVKAENQQQQQPPPPHQPQKCPRCESLNTKFCYYNNYSLSQPRYFCKTCRRYWTQGGTLRNVPVGGGCRKGKRAKATSSSSSSGDSSRHSQPPQPQPQPPVLPQAQQAVQAPQNLMIGSNPMMNSQLLYPAAGSGYLSSFAAIQSSFNQPQSFAQALMINSGNHDQLGSSSSSSSSTLSLLQGFNDHIPSSFGSQQQHQIPASAQFYPNPSDHHDQDQGMTMINQTSAKSSSQDWPHSFMMNNTSDQSALWNIGNANTTTGNVRRNTTSSTSDHDHQPSFSPNQWPDLPGSYGPPP